jgi:hypothetical protein
MANKKLAIAKGIFERTHTELKKKVVPLEEPTPGIALLWSLSLGLYHLTDALDEELSEIRASLDRLSRFPKRVK